MTLVGATKFCSLSKQRWLFNVKFHLFSLFNKIKQKMIKTVNLHNLKTKRVKRTMNCNVLVTCDIVTKKIANL